eukprot:gene11697-30886_t
MSFAKYSDAIKEGDTVMVYEGVQAGMIKPIVITKGSHYGNRFGRFPHDTMIGQQFGCKVQSSSKGGGWVYLLHPTPELWTVALPHRTQILYGTDISTVICYLDLKPGSVVCESGTGSGSLSHALIRSILPTGQ